MDDFFFVNWLQEVCYDQINRFIQICQLINFPISEEKMVWATQELIFLGIIINTIKCIVAIPQDKIDKAAASLDRIIRAKKVKVLDLQRLTGLLNFFCKAIVPGKAFTRRMYNKFKAMRQYHHIRVDAELRQDCAVWMEFLNQNDKICRPFVDFSINDPAMIIEMSSDASRNPQLGFGHYLRIQFHRNTFVDDGRIPFFTEGYVETLRYQDNQMAEIFWSAHKWPPAFIDTSECSIEVLELFAMACCISSHSNRLKNHRVIIFCDNTAVVHMINKASSTCKKCMFLIRIITAVSIKHNVRYFARYIKTKWNKFSDLLSRMQIKRFLQLAPKGTNQIGEPLPSNLWPIPKELWLRQ